VALRVVRQRGDRPRRRAESGCRRQARRASQAGDPPRALVRTWHRVPVRTWHRVPVRARHRVPVRARLPVPGRSWRRCPGQGCGQGPARRDPARCGHRAARRTRVRHNDAGRPAGGGSADPSADRSSDPGADRRQDRAAGRGPGADPRPGLFPGRTGPPHAGPGADPGRQGDRCARSADTGRQRQPPGAHDPHDHRHRCHGQPDRCLGRSGAGASGSPEGAQNRCRSCSLSSPRTPSRAAAATSRSPSIMKHQRMGRPRFATAAARLPLVSPPIPAQPGRATRRSP